MQISKRMVARMLLISAICLFQVNANMSLADGSHQGIKVAVHTDGNSYSRAEVIRLNASLENVGDNEVYVDRRMFWGGIAGGLKVVISDEQGRTVPAPMLQDALMPPPKPGDMSILIGLDSGFFYGTSLELPVNEWFPKSGKYSIRVIYKSLLHKDFVSPQLRKLPAMWADTAAIASSPVWIDIIH